MQELSARLTMNTAAFGAGVSQATAAMQGMAGGVQQANQEFNSLGTLINGLVGTGVVMMARRVVDATFDLAELGARARDVQNNLEKFAGSAQAATGFLEAVTTAAGGTVNRMDAMAVASKMLQMGLADNATTMSLYVEGAVRLGDQTRSSSQRIDEMTQLLKNLNVNMLDNFGLSRQVISARTDELVATQGLTREQGMLQAIQEEIIRQLGVLGPATEDGAKSFDRMAVAMENLKIALGSSFVGEGIANAMGGLASLLTEATAGFEAFQEGTAWTNLWTNLMKQLGIETTRAAEDAAAATSTLGDAVARTNLAFSSARPPILDYIDSLNEAHATMGEIYERMGDLNRVTAEESGSGFAGAEARVRARLLGASDNLTRAQMEKLYETYIGGFQRIYAAVGNLTEFQLAMQVDDYLRMLDAELALYEDHSEDIVDTANTTASRVTEAYRGAAQGMQGFDLGSLLTPTGVTSEDLAATAAGTYVEKWDENRRRALAVAERGFAELVANPEWVQALEIPEEVMSGSEAGLMRWASTLGESIGNLMRPDLINWDAAMALLAEEGVLSLSEKFNEQAGQLTMAATTAGALQRDLDKNRELMEASGKSLWKTIEPGFVKALNNANFVWQVAYAVAPQVAEMLDDRWGVGPGT